MAPKRKLEGNLPPGYPKSITIDGIKYYPKLGRGARKKVKGGRPRRDLTVLYYESDSGAELDCQFVVNQFATRGTSASNVVFEDDPPIEPPNVPTLSFAAPDPPSVSTPSISPPTIEPISQIEATTQQDQPAERPEPDVSTTVMNIKLELPESCSLSAVSQNVTTHNYFNLRQSSPSSSLTSSSSSQEPEEPQSPAPPSPPPPSPPPQFLRDPDRQPIEIRSRVAQYFPWEGILTTAPNGDILYRSQLGGHQVV